MRSNDPDPPPYCAIEAAVEVLGGRWKLAILQKLLAGPHRFGELRRALPGVTQRMLTRQLRELEADGLVTRTVHQQVPPRVDYALTEIGHSLETIAGLLEEWGHWYRSVRPQQLTSPIGNRTADVAG